MMPPAIVSLSKTLLDACVIPRKCAKQNSASVKPNNKSFCIKEMGFKAQEEGLPGQGKNYPNLIIPDSANFTDLRRLREKYNLERMRRGSSAMRANSREVL
jgi:hypothetical protein